MSYSFTPDTTQWNAGNARACARFAHLAYEADATQAAAALRMDHSLHTFQPVEAALTDTQAFVASNDQVVVAAFRGTEPKIQDWLTDARTAPVPFHVGKVHRGFLRAFDSIWELVAAEISRQQTRGQTLWLTGHSLGGALATLAAAKLRLGPDPKEVHGLYTFGCPRVGDLDFRVAFDSDFSARAFRYVNEDDVVPQLAPEDLGFTHVGRLLWFDAVSRLRRDVGGYRELIEASRVDFASVLAGVPPPLENHSMRYYLAKAGTETGQAWS